MEVCDLPICYFVEYQPAWLNCDGVDVFSIKTIARDPAWFEKNKPLMKSFYDELMYEREHYVPPPPPPKLIRDALYDDIAHARVGAMLFVEDDADDGSNPLFLEDV